MRTLLPFILAAMAMLRSSSGWAAVVTTTADDGPGSLRQTIASAAPGETVTFAVTGTIDLTSGELLITNNLTLTGPGASQLTVQRSTASGTTDFRVFNIRPGKPGTVTISGLTVNNGRADSGGGVFNQFGAGADLLMHDMVISGNAATNAGGGIKNNGTLTLDQVVITNNSAGGGPAGRNGSGGGFDNEGDLIVSNSRIENNVAVGGANADGIGGGINNRATALLTNCTVNGNRAEGSAGGGKAAGGGISNSSGTMTNFDCTISGNVASGGNGPAGGGARGGGIASDHGSFHLERCTVSQNIATGGNGTAGAGGPGDGGGVANGDGTVTLENSTVSGNSATPGTGTVAGDTTASGGLFNGDGTTTLKHTTVTANTAGAGSPQPGCGVFLGPGSLELANTIVAGNSAGFDLFSIASDTTILASFNLLGSTNVPIQTVGTSNLFNVTAAQLRLGPLTTNGGLTLTHALLCGSLAIDTGDNTDAPATDQRGMDFLRIFPTNGVIDIGAYEDNNRAPTVLCPSPTTLESNTSTGLLATVSVQVTDADGDSLDVIWSVDGTSLQTNHVAVSPSVATTISFTNFFALGTHAILVRVSDTKQCEASCSTTLEIRVPNKAPVAVNDSYRVNENAVLTVPPTSGVLTNDTDADGDALTAELVSGPTHAASFTLNPNGSFNYTPTPGYVGPDSFTYRAKDGQTNSAPATVNIIVLAPNTAPTAVNDSYRVNENAVLAVPPTSGVLTNDTDADGDALTAELVSGPTHAASFTLNPDGSFNYTPTPGYVGPDSFTYRAKDGQTNSAPATVNITVLALNAAPTALNDTYSVGENAVLAVPPTSGVLTNDTDADGDALTAELVSGPTHAASFTLNPDGSFSYTPTPGYVGPDSFTYRAKDSQTNSTPATVNITVLASNTAPTALNDTYSVLQNAVLAVPPTSGVLTNDTDADGDALTAQLVSGPTHAASFTLNPDGSFSYTPTPGYVGPDSFTYRARDGQTNSAPATVTITVMEANATPTARDDTYSVSENAVLAVPPTSGVLTNDTDADGDALTAELVSGPTHAASFTLNPDGSFNYTPVPGYVGPDSFTYRARDGQTNSAPATVSITVKAGPAQGCDLYPIALHQQSLDGVAVGTVIHDIYNGVQPGNFGWLTWVGSPNEPTLGTSLTPPGDSRTYVNPNNRNDHVVSVGDWVQGKPGITNSRQIREALDALKEIDITVPVWDQARATGNNSLYRVVAFARVRLVSYQLPRQNRISAQFLGLVDCNEPVTLDRRNGNALRPHPVHPR